MNNTITTTATAKVENPTKTTTIPKTQGTGAKTNVATGDASIRAIVYLRSATVAQNEDIQHQSVIERQRQACITKAKELGVDIVDEYVDRGASGNTMKRPGLQRLLERTKSKDIGYVIVQRHDRLSRNSLDDVRMQLRFQTAGIRLMSCTEEPAESVSEQFLHDVMTTMAAFYVSQAAKDVQDGITKKLQAGETPFRAPLGYCNVRAIREGRRSNTVVVDPERAPHLRYAFRRFASGTCSLAALCDELTARGLTTAPTKDHAGKPMTVAQLQRTLRNPYYVGVVRHDGEEYVGNHEALVNREEFERVQRVLDGSTAQVGDETVASPA